MTDQPPKTVEEIVAENATLRAEVSRLQSSVASLQSTVVNRDSEIARLRRPKAPPRLLDRQAADKFKRPAYLR